MTQKEFDKFHREEKDQFGNILKVGDYVFYSPYYRQVRIYKIAHFTSSGKCKADEVWPSKCWSAYPYTENLVKLDPDMYNFIHKNITPLYEQQDNSDS